MNGKMDMMRDAAVRILRDRYGLSADDAETDDQCQISEGSDPGAFVQVWVWVPQEDLADPLANYTDAEHDAALKRISADMEGGAA